MTRFTLTAAVLLALVLPSRAESVSLPLGEKPIVILRENGDVLIDWSAVEKVNADKTADGLTIFAARVMLAIRDQKWKPIRTRRHRP